MYLFMRGPASFSSFKYVQSVLEETKVEPEIPNENTPETVKCTNPYSWCSGHDPLVLRSQCNWLNANWMYCAQTAYGFSVLIIGVYLLVALAWSDKFVLNNQYSAKTLHIEKQNDGGLADRKWNSLGGMTPYVELELLSQSTDVVHGPVAYKIWEDFSHNTRSLESRDNFFRGKHYGPENFEMFINNPWALSVLSSISPVMYLMTLVCVFILSFVGCVITQQMRITSNNEKYKEWLPTLKISIERITLIVFAIAVFVRIARQGTLASIPWGL